MLCMTRGCTRKAALIPKYGLCMICYTAAKNAVEVGSTTWGELINLGLALPQDLKIENTENLFLQSLFNAREKRNAIS